MQSARNENSTLGEPSRWMRAGLLFAGVIATLALLPYSWGRILVTTLLVGAPEPAFVAMLAVGIAMVWGVCYGTRRGTQPAGRWITLAAVAVLWIVTNAVVASVCCGPFSPRLYVVIGYTLGSLWVLWLAWIGLPPLNVAGKLAVLVVLVGLGAGFFIVFRVESLMGDNQANFAWRDWGQPEASAPALPSAPRQLPSALDNGESHDDYPQFLGPDRTACLTGVRLNLDWSVHPPRELWRRGVGAGWGAFAVQGNYAVTQEQHGETECTVCYHARTGAEIWRHRYAARFYDGFGGVGPRATPTIDADQVFAVGATGVLSCLDLATGEVRWSRDMLQDSGAANQQYGVAGSPLVAREMVIVCPTGQSGPTLAAYDRATGDRAWEAGADRASYASPVLADLGGTPQVVAYSSTQVAGFDVATGERLWDFPWANSEGINASQPVLHAGASNRVLVSTGYGIGAALFEVRRSGAGTLAVEPLWTSRSLKTKFATPVCRGDRIIGLDEGILTCLDARNGRKIWKRGRYGHGQILWTANALLVQTEFGDIVLVALRDDGPVERGSLPALHAKTWNHPALAAPLLLVRNDREAACYELTLEASGIRKPEGTVPASSL